MNGHISSNEWDALFRGNDALDSVVLLNSPSATEQQCVSIFVTNPSAGCECQRLLKSICWVTAEKDSQDCHKHKHQPLQGCLSWLYSSSHWPFYDLEYFPCVWSLLAWLLLVHINRFLPLLLFPYNWRKFGGRWKVFCLSWLLSVENQIITVYHRF